VFFRGNFFTDMSTPYKTARDEMLGTQRIFAVILVAFVMPIVGRMLALLLPKRRDRVMGRSVRQ
jgi:hypothetical protein